MEQTKLELYWSELPIGRENAATYSTLCDVWGCTERTVRRILHELSLFDNGDDFILIRSAFGKGFYKTDNPDEIELFKQECLNKGRSVFAPIKKINRVLRGNETQYTFDNNLRVIREECGLKQGEVCRLMKKHDRAFDKSLLSKMENGVCLPTPFQTIHLAQIYGVTPVDLFGMELHY